MTLQIKFEKVKCCICGSENQKNIDLTVGQFGFAVSPVECDCGLVFLNPRWSKHNYDHFYANHYTSFYNVSPQQMQDNTKVIIQRLHSINPNSILELGCNNGEGLLEMKKKFPNAVLHGIEMSKKCIQSCNDKGVNIIANDFLESWNGKYDLIIARHVLEHTLDPIKFLENIKISLNENGIAYIAVPDQDNPRTELRDYTDYKQYWYRVVHTYYFNKQTLFRLLQKVGLTAIHWGQENNELYIFCQKH